MAEEKPDRDEPEREDPAVLPAREAMAIIAPSTGSDPVTSEDRDEHVDSRDSPSSET